MDIKELLFKLKEPSTWQGIAVGVGALGYKVPEDFQALVMGGAAFAVVCINIFWKKDSQTRGTGDGNN